MFLPIVGFYGEALWLALYAGLAISILGCYGLVMVLREVQTEGSAILLLLGFILFWPLAVLGFFVYALVTIAKRPPKPSPVFATRAAVPVREPVLR